MTSPHQVARPTEPTHLRQQDRCDRCGSQAYVEVRLPHGSLLFCAHHFGVFEAALRPRAVAVHDERHRLRDVA